MTLPSLGFRRTTERAARHPFVWTARELSLDALSGQTGVLTRTATAASLDSVGASYTVNHSQPGWTAVGGVAALDLGSAGGALAEQVSWAFPLTSGIALSGLFDFFEHGTAAVTGGASIGAISNSASAAARLYWTCTSGHQYSVTHDPTGAAAVTSTPAVTPSAADRCRFRWWVYSDGSVQAWLSRNGGAETAGSRSSAKTFAASWSATTKLWLNQLGTGAFNYGCNQFVGIAVAQGNLTQAQLMAVLA